MAGKDTNTGAKRARELRDELGLAVDEPLACILTLIEERLDLPVILSVLPEGIAGCCWRDEDRVLLWVNGTQADVRQRFTLAHELGHVRCGHDASIAVDSFETISGRTTDAREIQANAFAAELLAPSDGVRSALDGDPSLDDVVLLAARFGISTIAALYRLNTLGLTARYGTLKREIEEGLADAVWERLAPPPLEDAIAKLDVELLPRLSPALAGSALAALASGATSVGDAASAAGCEPDQLASGALTIRV